jgi:acetyl/propionyl-CoA carboxylase alpha subunit
MKKKNSGILAMVSMFIIFLAGCNQEPTIKVETASAAVEAAKTAEADKYLPSEFTALQDTLTAVLASIEEEKAKSFSSRSFKSIEEKLDAIIADAETLKSNTETRKAEVRVQVEESLAMLIKTIEQDKELISKTLKNARNKAVVEAMQNEITVIESSVAEINTLVGNGDYLTALQKVNVANGKATSLYAQLTQGTPR